LFGLLVLASAYFNYKQFGSRLIEIVFALAGIGSVIVGLFPEDTFVVNGIPVIHYAGALMAFVLGGISAIISYRITKEPFRYFSVILGVAALVATLLFVLTADIGYLGLGVGGMERMMAYPTIIWMVSFGGYLLGVYSK